MKSLTIPTIALLILCAILACAQKPGTKPVTPPHVAPATDAQPARVVGECKCGVNCKCRHTDPFYITKPVRDKTDTGWWYWERIKDEWKWTFYADNKAAEVAVNVATGCFGGACSPRRRGG